LEDNNKHCSDSRFLSEELVDLTGQSILLISEADQLEILGQVFRPVFCGKVVRVTKDTVTLYPVQIRMHNAPEFSFPTPLRFPIYKLVMVAPFDCAVRFPLT